MPKLATIPSERTLRYSVWSDIKRLRIGRAVSYLLFGRKYGAGSFGAKRSVFASFVPNDGMALEIAPWHNPFLSGPNVRTFDVVDADTLRARAPAHNVSKDRIGHVDYVSPNGDLSIIPDSFDVVYSSHCAEHTPDIISHFNQVADLLNDGGLYYMFLPDKRFCFDHFIPETSIVDVLQAHIEKRTNHTIRSILHNGLLTTHNDAKRHWRGDHGRPQMLHKNIDFKGAVESYRKPVDEYIDSHAWQFTPDSFRAIFKQLAEAGYCKLSPARVFNTLINSHEFAVIMKKDTCLI